MIYYWKKKTWLKVHLQSIFYLTDVICCGCVLMDANIHFKIFDVHSILSEEWVVSSSKTCFCLLKLALWQWRKVKIISERHDHISQNSMAFLKSKMVSFKLNFNRINYSIQYVTFPQTGLSILIRSVWQSEPLKNY